MELIKIQQNEQGSSVVSARDLYLFLGYDKSQWSRWYKKNIIENQFCFENEDWVAIDIVSNGNETKDFALTLDFAKRISMMAKTEKGEDVRKYFIECEKQLKEITIHSYQIEDPIKRAEKWIEEQKEKEALKIETQQKQLQINIQQEKIQVDAPKVEYFDELIDRELYLNLRDTAKELGQKPKKFNEWLIEKNFIYRTTGENKVIKPTSAASKAGLLVLKEFKNSNKKITGNQTLTTVKGRATFLKLLQH